MSTYFDVVVMDACSSVMRVAPRSLKHMRRITPQIWAGKVGTAATRTPVAIPAMAKQMSNGERTIFFKEFLPNEVHVTPIAATVPDAAPTANMTPIMPGCLLNSSSIKIGPILRLSVCVK